LDPFLGEIKLLPWGWAPKNWRLCDGSLVSIQSNPALFALLGTQYGGNGTTNFALPDLRGRAPVHFGQTYAQGEPTGVETVTLVLSQLPIHNHSLFGTSQDGSQNVANAILAKSNPAADPHYAPDAPTISLNPTSVHVAGSGGPHDNMQPYLVLNYCIAISGVFPSRN
jgi:microcystin-dependent protein